MISSDAQFGRATAMETNAGLLLLLYLSLRSPRKLFHWVL